MMPLGLARKLVQAWTGQELDVSEARPTMQVLNPGSAPMLKFPGKCADRTDIQPLKPNHRTHPLIRGAIMAGPWSYHCMARMS